MNVSLKILAASSALLLLLNASLSAAAGKTLEDLAIFKAGGLTQGQWRMELLSSNEPMLNSGAAAIGKMSLCADIAKQMAKNNQLDEQSCTPKVLSNSSELADVELSCKDGGHGHVKVNKEAEHSYVLDSEITDKDGKTRAIKARYTYEGACKGDAVIQLDKNSAACKKMGDVDVAKLTEMCAKAPEQYRAQCEQQLKQMGNMCQ